MNWPNESARKQLLQVIERYSSILLVAMGFVTIPAMVGLLFWDLSAAEQTWFVAVSLAAWALFLSNFLLKLLVAPDRLRYLRNNPLDPVVVLLPWLRILALAYFVVFAFRGALGITRASGYGLLLLALGVVSIGSTIIFSIESGSNSEFTTFGDALWWTFVTVTTVGYGDTVPDSTWGRVVAVVVMVSGVTLYSASAAYLASLLIGRQAKSGDNAKLDAIIAELKQLKRRLEPRD